MQSLALIFRKLFKIYSTFIKYTIYKNQREKYVILSIDLIHAVKRVPEAKKSLSCMRFKVYIHIYLCTHSNRERFKYYSCYTTLFCMYNVPNININLDKVIHENNRIEDVTLYVLHIWP